MTFLRRAVRTTVAVLPLAFLLSLWIHSVWEALAIVVAAVFYSAVAP